MSDAGEGEIGRLRSRIDALELECARLRDFAALAAHELLRPVIVAQESAARLIEADQGTLDGAARTDLELLRTASSQARVLVDTLLADAQRGDAALATEPVDLVQVARDCVEALKPDIGALAVRVRLGELPVVAGDAVLLTAVLRNLLMNAIRHGSGRRGEIRVFAEPVDGGWRVAVDSPGEPLSEAERQALFGRDPGERRGLGLVLVRRIVERHGGSVGAMSPDGSTNRFFFTLPADPSQMFRSR